MTSRVDALLQAALWTGSVGLAGCRECDDLPAAPDEGAAGLQLVGGRFLDDELVELVFSSALAPVQGVDPAKFRLSMAHGSAERGRLTCYEGVDYCDLSLGFSELGCASCGVDSGYDEDENCPEPTLVTELALDPDDDTRLRLHISLPLDPFRCAQIESAGTHSAIVVHHSAAGAPAIEDRGGQALEDIAPSWALSQDHAQTRDGLFPERETWVPIACPEDFG